MDKNYKQYLPKINFTLEVLLEGLRRTNLRIDNISGGGGGGSQDLQSVLTQGNSTILDFYKELSYPGLGSLKAGVLPLIDGPAAFTGASVDLEDGRYMKAGFLASEGVALFVETNINNQFELTTAKSLIFKFPIDKPEATYILATLDDILNINLDSRVYSNNAAAITGGLVVKDLYRTATGELRVVV